ncbi:hypothetical protein MPSEU_000067800 [Mayamaea pseudoterrestris]|nr:hypothetical protein MPSEU_000067800 [Mayamaea pseudoterrestris]
MQSPSANNSSNMEFDSDARRTAPRSDQLVSATLQRGFERMIIQSSAGLVIGGLAGLVLMRGGGGSSAARKGVAGLGAGLGLGSAWTRTSMDLEEMLGSAESK